MSPFSYSKTKHVRHQEPGAFASYRKYKPFLRLEFARKCVYCRMPDTMKGTDGFGVDHYRPKSIFPNLRATYSNLYYCCNQCNRRKTDYWPSPKLEATHFIPNPCDHVMFSHLKYESSSVVSRSQPGDVAMSYMDFNDSASIEQRQLMIDMIDLSTSKKQEIEFVIQRITHLRDSGSIAGVIANPRINQLQADLLLIEGNLRKLEGS